MPAARYVNIIMTTTDSPTETKRKDSSSQRGQISLSRYAIERKFDRFLGAG